MSNEEQRALTEVMTILEAAEDKDAIEQLAVLVASGNVKGMIGVDLKKKTAESRLERDSQNSTERRGSRRI